MWLILSVRFMLKLELNYHEWSDKMWFITKSRQDNDVTDCTSVIFVVPNYQDWLNNVWCMSKMRQYNDVIDRISMLYIENKTEILWLIQWGTVYEEDQIG